MLDELVGATVVPADDHSFRLLHQLSSQGGLVAARKIDVTLQPVDDVVLVGWVLASKLSLPESCIQLLDVFFDPLARPVNDVLPSSLVRQIIQFEAL